MSKLYNLFFLAFLVALSPAMRAGEIEQKQRASSCMKKSASCPLNLADLSAQLAWDISQCSVDEAHQWPFCKLEINTSIKDFQDTCFGEFQKLYGQWEETQRLFRRGCSEYETVFVKKHIDDPVRAMATYYLWSTFNLQNTRWHVYNKIAEVYRLLCAHDSPAKIIDPQLLTLDKFEDLRSSLITPKRPRRSSSA